LNQNVSKLNAAKKAVEFIENGMVVGLGTGSTAKIAIDLIGEKISEDFQIIGMPTSIKTEKQAIDLGIKLIGIDDAETIDLAIDGADEVSPDLALIKGLGGALLREKKVEKKAKELIIIIDESKLVKKLGEGFLPVEIKSSNYKNILIQISKLKCETQLRIESDNRPFITDNGNYICHCKFKNGISDPRELDKNIMNIDGVIDTGLFIDMATKIIVGNNTGTKIID
tara:strand:- start:2507 stop:3184 length:678 start_codon:yes stop_codon:yes gene_type:complete